MRTEKYLNGEVERTFEAATDALTHMARNIKQLYCNDGEARRRRTHSGTIYSVLKIVRRPIEVIYGH